MPRNGPPVVAIALVVAVLAGCSGTGPAPVAAPAPAAVPTTTPTPAPTAAPLTPAEERTLASLRVRCSTATTRCTR